MDFGPRPTELGKQLADRVGSVTVPLVDAEAAALPDAGGVYAVTLGKETV